LRLSKVSTGISGLDQILEGGLLKAGVYLVQGEPGTGKTILGNQICFHRVGAGGRVAYITLLAESHARMIQHMECFSFYDEKAIPSAMHYISAFDALATDGLAGVISVLSDEMRQRKADMIILDGLVTAAGASGSPQDLKLFVSQIQALSTLTGCTTVLLNSLGGLVLTTPEQTMVDGIVVLRQQLVGSRHERSLEVRKFRGAKILYGAHTFRIGEEGLVVFPQLEAVGVTNHSRIELHKRIGSGVPGLNEMLNGGYPMGSVTAIAGEEGTGKTLLGLQFLSQASAVEPALLFGLDESSEMAEAIAGAFGIDWKSLVEKGVLHTAWQPFYGESLDEVGYRLLSAVKHDGSKTPVHRRFWGGYRDAGLCGTRRRFFCGVVSGVTPPRDDDAFLGAIGTWRQGGHPSQSPHIPARRQYRASRRGNAQRCDVAVDIDRQDPG
jgi:circadian clock protein KaiC